MQAMETLSQSSRRRVAKAQGWQFWIDRGGTFTDVIGLSPAGELHVRKVPSAPSGGAAGDPGVRAARAILAATSAAPRAVAAVKVGTTVATNALLTRTGEPVVLVTTAGFADALRIGYQNRPDIFARHIVLPGPLYTTVIEARERIDAQGGVLTPLDGARLRADLERARRAGGRAVAIVFLHGWRHPQHEREAAACARAHRHALGRGAAGLPAPDRFRHGRHVHGRVVDRRRAAAALRAPHCGGAPDPTDAGRTQHRRGWRLDPDLHGRPLRGRPGFRGGGSGSGLLWARRTPHTHRCAGAARPPAARHPARGLRARRPLSDRCRRGGAQVRRTHGTGQRSVHARWLRGDARRIVPRGGYRVDGERHPP